jgi:hypothetical protein
MRWSLPTSRWTRYLSTPVAVGALLAVGVSTADGATINQWTCNGQQNQLSGMNSNLWNPLKVLVTAEQALAPELSR